MQAFLSQVWSLLMQSHWLLSGFANAMIMIVIGRVLIMGYREHSYLYQFEDKARFLDTWIALLLPFVRRLGLPRYRTNIALKLSRAGSRRDWETSHFMASQILYATALGIASYLLLVMLFSAPVWIVAFALVLGAFLPYLKLSDIASFRYKAVNRDLPYFIDYMSLAMGAGLDFNQALEKVISDAKQSPLREEFSLVLRNIKLGMSRAEALLEMERRLSSPALKLFAQTLVQGMELGADVVQTLHVMSESLQQKRFQEAEEIAGKISVRMMIPMMCFVMPSVMIVLLGPMILSYFQSN